MNWVILLLLIAAFLIGFLGARWVRSYALSQQMMDVPNDRSSHTAPTPRGGGLPITLVVLVAILLLGLVGLLHAGAFWSLFPAALLVAVIGWVDDHRQLSAAVRGLGYLLAAVWFVGFVGGLGEVSLGSVKVVSGSEFSIGPHPDPLPEGEGMQNAPHPNLPPNGGKELKGNLSLQGGKEIGSGVKDNPHPDLPPRGGKGIEEGVSVAKNDPHPGLPPERGKGIGTEGEGFTIVVPWLLIAVVLVLGIAWLTNLYNFMDGTDGLAGTQAVLAGGAGGLLLWLQGGEALALLAWVAAAASAGFLVWNWAPAKIFMGDVGSCLLGFLFGGLAVLGARYADLPVLLWAILLGFFIWDATFTLFMRLFRRERWYSAHRSHAYQRLVQLGLSHAQLAWLFLGINIVLLWPLAWWGYQEPAWLLAAFVISVVLMGLIWSAVQVYYYRHSSTGQGQGIAGF